MFCKAFIQDRFSLHLGNSFSERSKLRGTSVITICRSQGNEKSFAGSTQVVRSGGHGVRPRVSSRGPSPLEKSLYLTSGVLIAPCEFQMDFPGAPILCPFGGIATLLRTFPIIFLLEIGKASCRESVYLSVYIEVVAV